MKEILFLLESFERKDKYQYALLLMFALITVLLEMASIGMLLPLLGRMFNNPSMNFEFGNAIVGLNLNNAIIAFVVFVLVSMALKVSMQYYQIYINQKIGRKICSKVFYGALNKNYEFHINVNHGEISSILAKKAMDVVATAIQPGTVIVVNSIMSISMIAIYTYYMGYDMFIIALILGSIYGGMLGVFKNNLNNLSQKISTENTKIYSMISDSLGSIKEIKVNNSEYRMVGIFNEINESLRRSQTKYLSVASIPKSIIESLGFLVIGVYAYVEYLTSEKTGDIIFVELAGAAVVLQRLIPMFQNIYASLAAIKVGKGALIETIKYLTFEGQSGKGLQDLCGDIEVGSISYNYTNGRQVFNEVNIKIKQGEIVAIIGISGSGKSTLIDIITGLLRPGSGGVYVNGIKLNSENLHAWRETIGYAPQKPFLFDDTLLNNIVFKDEVEINREKLELALNVTALSNEIQKNNLSLEQRVGERGVKLSGGQGQRVVIARAIYRAKNVLILDEATSGLDFASEKLIMENLRRLKLTTLIITHNLDNLKYMDRVIDVSKFS